MQTLQIRPVTAADAGRLVDLHARCSETARYFRFHAAKPRLRAAEADYLAGVDGRARVALAATVVEDGGERMVADARFDVVGDGDAEAALLIRDDMAGRGLGRPGAQAAHRPGGFRADDRRAGRRPHPVDH